MHEQPLGVHTQLPRRPEARPDRAFHGPAEVGVGPHVEAVLAAELQRGADQARGGGLPDPPAGVGRPGVADVVGLLDDRLADRRAVADDDLEHGLGQTRLGEQLAP